MFMAIIYSRRRYRGWVCAKRIIYYIFKNKLMQGFEGFEAIKLVKEFKTKGWKRPL